MTDLAPAPLDLTKARAIAAMLDSSHDGEVVNAARALVRLAKAAGLSVDALIGTASQRPSQTVRDDLRTRSAESHNRSTEAYNAYMKGMAAFHTEMAAARTANRSEYDAATARETARRQTGRHRAWHDLLSKVQIATVGTKMLDATEQQLVFSTLAVARDRGWMPGDSQLAHLVTIARRLGIV